MAELEGLGLRQFAMPVPARSRVIDAVCLVLGAGLVFAALRLGGTATVLAVPGVCLIGIGIYLLTRKQTLADTNTVAAAFQSALAEQYGDAAHTPEGRVTCLRVYLDVAQRMAEIVEQVSGQSYSSRTRSFEPDVALLEVRANASGRRLRASVPDRTGQRSVYLLDLSPEEAERAQALLHARDIELSGVLEVGCSSAETAIEAIERVLTEVFGLPADHTAQFRLLCADPDWLLGESRP
jgi:hypothetical protein